MKVNAKSRRDAALLEKVREYILDLSELSSLRKVADRVGLGHSTIHHFVNGTDPHPRVWRTLRAFYFAETGMGANPKREAISALLDGLEGDGLAEGERRLLDAVESAFLDAGAPAPEWVGVIRGGN